MKHVVIIGGGASGLACALQLSKYPEHFYVEVVERMPSIGRKLQATGNGHANLSNRHLSSFAYAGDVDGFYPIVQEFQIETLANDLGIALRTKNDLVYPYNEQAKSVVLAFEEKLRQAGVRFIVDQEVTSVTHLHQGYVIKTSKDTSLRADFVIFAGGGKSQESLGSNGSIYRLLDRLNVKMAPLQDVLVPFVNRGFPSHLKGLRIHGTFSIEYQGKVCHVQKGEVLFSKEGVSGIAALQLSRYYQKGAVLYLNLVDELDEGTLKHYYELHCHDDNPYLGLVHSDLAKYLNRSTTSSYEDFVQRLTRLSFPIESTRGFEASQVTRGGVLKQEVSDHLELMNHPNAFVLGETLNIDGDCGGYNLHFAFACGYHVANYLISKEE